MASALEHIRILDLSRVLAGPSCTQILGDMGADVIKIERPGEGDDTRKWGPPFLEDADGAETSESAYYLSCNRNKRSLAIDITRPEGQELIHRLADECDVLVQNFKPGGLAKYGLDYEQMKDRHPHLVYCAISGYGQNGPLGAEPGYDLVAQAMGGLMAYTGPDVDGVPTKAGVAVSDLFTGLYAVIGILGALEARRTTGRGQLVDVALLDCTTAMMSYFCQTYLTTGKLPKRAGNGNPTIVPYQSFPTADVPVVIAVGNNGQFATFCRVAGVPELAQDPRFSTNRARVENRAVLVPMLEAITAGKPSTFWIAELRNAGIPVGPVNTIDKVFAEPQIQARQMEIKMEHPLVGRPVHFVGSPLKLSETPVAYRKAPPVRGQHSDEVLKRVLKMNADEIKRLCQGGVVERGTGFDAPSSAANDIPSQGAGSTHSPQAGNGCANGPR